MNEKFGRQEKLKSKILIDQMFAEGQSLKKYPLILIYKPIAYAEPENHKTGVSVSKRKFSKAVDRIKLKRLMRESFRKNKYLVTNKLESSYAFMFIYIGREKLSYFKIFSATEELLKSLVKKEKSETR